MEMEKHVAGNSVYVLVHSDVIFALSNGRLTATVKSRIADLRIKTGAWAEWIGNILNVNLDQLISDVLLSLIAQKIADYAQDLGLPDETPIESIEIRANDVLFNLCLPFPGCAPGNGYARKSFTLADSNHASHIPGVNSIYEWSPGELGNKGNAALVVTLFFDNLQLHTVASINNGDPATVGDDHLTEWYREDVGNPGQNRIILYLPADYRVDDLTSINFGPTGWHNWDDKIGSIIVRPGGRFNGNRLVIGEHPIGVGGFDQALTVGYWSMQLQDNRVLFNAISRLRVTPDPILTVYVDFGYSGVETGSASQPFNLLSEALPVVASGGTIIVHSGSSSEPLSISKKCTITASGGTVTIGQ